MGLMRSLLVGALVVVSGSTASAAMSVRVCNEGQLDVWVALAYEEWGAWSSDWVSEGWFKVAAGHCDVVYASSSICNEYSSPVSYCARVRAVYWFKDATGVGGIANVRDPNYPASGERICVAEAGLAGHRAAPDANCSGGGRFLAPAAAKIDTYRGNGPPNYGRDFQGFTLRVALTSRDRAIPPAGAAVGQGTPRAVPPAGADGPGKLTDFAPVLSGAMERSGRSSRTWRACIEPAVVEAQSWKTPPAGRIQSLEDAISQFLSIHKNKVWTSESKVWIRITERSGRFVVEEFKGECSKFYEIE